MSRVAIVVLTLAAGCGGACPTSQEPRRRAQWEIELEARQSLPLVPSGSIAIKRDVRNLVADVDAGSFAGAFHEVMRDPDRRFGLIRVDRAAARRGRPFSVGEKFQGRYSLEDAISEQLPQRARRFFGKVADEEPVGEWLCRIENGHTSDFGMITRLELEAPPGEPRVLRYDYLQGSPIAGSSTFIVTDINDADVLRRFGVERACRVEQIFEYQELTRSFARFFSQGGLKLHNQVVWSQAEQAAELAGGRILESDIPAEYRHL